MRSSLVTQTIWHEFLKIVKEEVGSRIVETWLKALVFVRWEASVKTVYLQAPNAFVKGWVQDNYCSLIKLHLGRLLHETDLLLVFIDQDQVSITPALAEQAPKIEPRAHTLPVKKAAHSSHSSSKQIIKSVLNAAYKFDTFIVGPNNSLAYAAAQAVVEKPGILYNPLFIYGDSGLGKTHLLHAVGNALAGLHNKLRIVYQSADRFVNEFIHAIRFDKVSHFEVRYKDIDILLIDDIQFISNKEQTQEAFFHIFNALYESRKQIVFSSDSLPRDIAGLADRLRSRLDGGLIADIQPPTLEIKIAILKSKAAVHQVYLDDTIAYYIASCAKNNVRELEGFLIRLLAFSSITGQAITLELAQKALDRSLMHEQPKVVTLDLQRIASKVAHYYDYTLQELRSSKRHKDVTRARHVAMYFMKKFTDKSLIDIAVFWYRKDHTTVIHALDKIHHWIETDELFSNEIKKIEQLLLA